MDVAEDGAGWGSTGLSELGTSVADVSGTDGAGSGSWGGLSAVSMAIGVVGIAAKSVSASTPGVFSFLSKNLKHK